MKQRLEAISAARLSHLEFREGMRWTFVNPSNALLISPAFVGKGAAEAWRAPFQEQLAMLRAAEAEAAAKAAEAAAEAA